MAEKKVIEVELGNIEVNPYQPRKHFSPKELNALAESFRSVGLLQPPIVRPSSRQLGNYVLISGERRYRAAALAGMEKIPVIVDHKAEEECAEAALVENIQRVDLNPMEIARALEKLMTDFHYRQEGIAKRVGKSRSTVANYLRLLSLPLRIQESLASGAISMGHAKAILSLKTKEEQLRFFDKITQRGLSVRVSEYASQNGEKKRQSDCFVKRVQEKIQETLGTKVAVVQGKGQRGKIIIDYYSLDDLERLVEVLGSGAFRDDTEA